MFPRFLVCGRFGRLLVLAMWMAGVLPGARSAGDGNWPRWRGPHDNGVAAPGDYPAKLDPAANLLWKASLPGKGCSTPIVWERRIYVTAPAEGEDAVLAFDWAGQKLWQTKLGAEKAGKHRNASGSNPSPATDGRAVFVGFKSGRFAALEFDGKIRWQVNIVERFGPDTLFWDYAASPALTEKNVVVTRMHNGESWLAAFDKVTGEMRWKVARNYETPRENDNAYTTPLVFNHQGREALLAWGGEHLTIHEAADGRLLWSCGGFNPTGGQNWPSVATPVVVGDIAVVPFARNDRGIPRLHGLRLSGSGDTTATNRLWARSNTGTFVPSPAADQGRVYLLRDKGEVECLDPQTGEAHWAGAFPKAGANFYGSPVLAGGRLFAVREDGAMFVAAVDGKFEVRNQSALGERVIASPVPVGGRVLIRGEKHLHAFGAR